MKICANLSLLFTDRPLLQRIEMAAEVGFDGVEIQFPYDVPAQALRTALDKAAMPLALINLPTGDLMVGGAGLAAVPERRKEFASALAQALDYAELARPAMVNVLAGRALSGITRAAALECLQLNLHQAARCFETLSIGVVIEGINIHDMPGFLLNTAEDLHQMLDKVGHGNLSAQLDFYHLRRMGCDVEEAIRCLSGRIGHVQCADCPGRGAPGTGGIDFHRMLRTLRSTGYDGWLGAEYLPGRDTAATLGWLPEWRSWLT